MATDSPASARTPLRLIVHGANGRMGRALLRLAAEAPETWQVVGAVSRKVGQRVIDGVPQFAASELGGLPDCDVVVDFSLPEAFDPLLASCVAHGRALVSGTTGLTDAQSAAIDAATARIPVHRLVVIPGRGHYAAYLDSFGTIWPEIERWFGRHLGTVEPTVLEA